MDREYVLGTHDEEVARLGLQHAVWRPHMLDAWRRGGFTRDQHIIDFGAGPGYASLDLADVVGPMGKVLALDRSARFLAHLEAAAKLRGVAQIQTHEIDLESDSPPADWADGAWGRWIFAFLKTPRAALEGLVRAVRRGGRIVVYEYVDYATWRLVPRVASFDAFVAAVMASWRAEGGEPNIGVELIPWLEAAGCRIEGVRTISDVVGPSNFVWQWPAGFFEIGLARLVQLGRVAAAEAEAMRVDYAAALREPNTRLVTPLVCEIIATRL